jgi:hypothetical protein
MHLYFQPNANPILLSKSGLTLAQHGSLIAVTQQVAQGMPVCQLLVLRCG